MSPYLINVEPINVTLSPFRVGNTSVNVRVNSISSVSLDDSTSLSISTIEPFFLYDCGFDIEASSSHGDFPLPIKNYKKLATNILENYYSCSDEFRANYDISMLGQEILCAFELTDHKLIYIAKVYPKEKNLASLNFENLIGIFDISTPNMIEIVSHQSSLAR